MSIYNMPAWANRTGDAATLAAELNTPAAITPMTLVEFFGAVVAAGGDGEKLGELWNLGGGDFVRRAEILLAAGDLAGISGLLATIPASTRTAMGAATLTAIQTVIGANVVSAGAKFHDIEEDGPLVDEYTAEWVTDWLTIRGYTWTGTEWARA